MKHAIEVIVLSIVVHSLATPANAAFLTINDDRIFYEETGDGEALLLIAGGSGMDLHQWSLVAPILGESYRVILFDPRGIGKSDNPTTRYSDAGDIEALISQLELESVGVIGLSSGGGLALEFALAYPHRVRSLIVAAPFVPGFEFSQAMLSRLERFNVAVERGRDAYLDTMLADPHFIPAPLNPGIRKLARENMSFNFDKAAGFDPSLPLPVSPPLIDRLGDISVATLLLAGALDHPEVQRRNDFLHREISRSHTQLIEDAGHNAPLENPQAFIEAIRPFLLETM